MLVATIAAFAAFLPATASANVTPTVSTVYSTNVPGAHGDYTNIQSFSYNGSTEPAAGSEDLKKWIVDSPAGLVGNPNAIPEADRCDRAAFDPSGTMSPLNTTGACPASSKVGSALVYLVTDANEGTCPGPPWGFPTGCIPGGSDIATLTGNIYLLKNIPTNPEIPVTLGTIFTNSTSYQAIPCGARMPAAAPPCLLQPKTKSVLQPVTSEGGAISDFRIRTVPADFSSPPFAFLPSPPYTAYPGTPVHIRRIDQKLFGYPNNDTTKPPFLTFPTNCGPWNTTSFARAWTTNSGTITGLDPSNPTDTYMQANVDPHTPDCTTLAPFAPSASVALSTGDRNSHPQADITVNAGGAPGVDYPKKTISTMPASITIDTTNLPPLCEAADRNAGTCPANTKVGTATITTPMLTAGLTGDVYVVRGTGKAIPDLSIFFNNPPNSIQAFRMDGTTQFVGPSGNQVQTTFDNGPQNPFTSFGITIFGGTGGLISIRACPTDSSSPADGPITMAMTGFSGQTRTTSSTPVLKDCFGVAKLKKISRCVKTKLKVSPSYQSRDQLQKSELWVKGKNIKKYKRIKTLKKSPFGFSVTLSNAKYKHGTYKYKVRAVYKPTASNPKNVVVQQFSHFKKC